MKQKERPIGVTILGSLNRILFGFISLLMWSFGFLMSFNDQWLKKLPQFRSPIMLRIFLLYGIIISTGLMITGDGILKLKEKARINTIYVGIFMLIFNFLFNLNYIFLFNFWVGLIYPCLLIYFFTRPKVKKQFIN